MLVKNEALISKTASLPFTGGLLPNWNVTDGALVHESYALGGDQRHAGHLNNQCGTLSG